jgi:two-component system, sensor histidine kinase and response regulator
MASPTPLPETRDRTRRLTAEDVAARALLEATKIDEAAPKILEGICEAFGWEHGALWTVDRGADLLRCAEIWTSPAASFPEFDNISRTATFARGIGLPGRVWATGEPAWIPDVVLDPNFPRAAAASREGLHAAFGFPVLLRGEVLSVMEFFSREVREPDESLLSMLRTVGSQIGMFIDRRRAQEDLDRFFTLSLDMLCVAGFDGYFKRVNPAWQRILGYTDAELLSRPYFELVHPDDRNATVKEARKAAQGQEIFYFENRYFHKDGTIRWLLWTASPFPEQQVIYAAARDITERKEAEETLASYARDLRLTHTELEDQAARLAQLVRELETAKHKAEDATATKSAFLANMSHEIRTPLNAILGMTTLALGTKLSSEQQDYLTTVKSSADSLLEIVNDVLDFSKIEAKRLDLDYQAFDLREAVGDAAKLLALRAAEKGLELACDITPEVPASLVGDAGRLRQILLNVLGNAVKFTNEGEVVLRVATEPSDEGPGRSNLHFTVTDTGIGIPADKLEHIFEAFTQADSSTTRRFGGTGLGLAIARKLVELMGGRLWVESNVGRGSTFHFTVPFDEPDGGAVPIVQEPKAIEGLRVLVVDDNATNRRILQTMLTSWHLKPTAVGGATEAWTALNHARSVDEPVQLVITDGQMPEVDGFALTRQIKKDPDLRHTPVVMLTSVGHAEDAAQSRRSGVDVYLTKPVKHSDLLDALATLFGGSVRRDRAETAPQPASSPVRPLRILVAEDHPVNRKLVTTLLAKRGHTVESVDNGRSAVDAIALAGARPFDIVIMDVQMPTMSGLEASVAIRERERTTGEHVPIVALTAHAMQGDRERCLQAGMDSYLSKPIDVDRLIATVEAAGAGQSARGAAAPSSGASDAIFDEQAALRHTGGDRKLLRKIVNLFRADATMSLKKIGRALSRRNAEALWTTAHALKGSLATIGAEAARRTAADLERLGRAGSFDDARGRYANLQQQLRALDRMLITAGLVGPSRPRPADKSAKPRPRKRVRRGRS